MESLLWNVPPPQVVHLTHLSPGAVPPWALSRLLRPELVALGLQHTWHPEHPFPHLPLFLGRAPLFAWFVPSFWWNVSSGCCMFQDAVLCLSHLCGWDMVVIFQLVFHLQGLVLVLWYFLFSFWKSYYSDDVLLGWWFDFNMFSLRFFSLPNLVFWVMSWAISSKFSLTFKKLMLSHF